MTQDGCIKIDAGLDYLTVVSDTQAARNSLCKLGEKLHDRMAVQGGIPKFTMRSGFEGYELNKLFVGVRGERAMIVCKGSIANEVFQAIDWNGTHCTRIDLQCTVWANLGENWAQVQSEAAEKRRLELLPVPSGKPLLIHSPSGEGDTLQMGSRSSPRFGRLYDKGRQSGIEAYAGAWRYEVEYKYEGASRMCSTLRRAGHDPFTVSAIVAGQYTHWGIEVPWDAGTTIAPDVLGKVKSDADKKLAWLRDQVAGTVDKLRQMGLEWEVLEALGLVNTENGGNAH